MASFVRKVLKKLELPEEEKTNPWSNEDIRPVPPERQTWSKSDYIHSYASQY